MRSPLFNHSATHPAKETTHIAQGRNGVVMMTRYEIGNLSIPVVTLSQSSFDGERVVVAGPGPKPKSRKVQQ